MVAAGQPREDVEHDGAAQADHVGRRARAVRHAGVAPDGEDEPWIVQPQPRLLHAA